MMTGAYDTQNRQFWRAALSNKPLLYPDEQVVSYLANEWPDRQANGRRTALDVGYGTGRHLRLLRDYGFSVHGVDLSPDAEEGFAQWSEADRQGIVVRTIDQFAADLYPPASLDLAIAYGVMFLLPQRQMELDLTALRGWLRPGGGAIINFRTPRSWFCGLGREVAPGTFDLDDRAGPYAGAIYTFLDPDESAALLDRVGFDIVNKEYLELHKRNASEVHAWSTYWVRVP